MTATTVETHAGASAKMKAMDLIGRLPERVTWDDIIYELYVRQKIDEGLKAAEEGRVLSHEDVKKRFCSK